MLAKQESVIRLATQSVFVTKPNYTTNRKSNLEIILCTSKNTNHMSIKQLHMNLIL